MFRRLPVVLLGAICVFAAQAKHLYQYADAQGIVHFTDVKPLDGTPGVKSTLVRTDAAPLLHSREDGTDADRTIIFVNDAGGPVTVEIDVTDPQNVRTEPEVLPARVVLPGRSETRALHIAATDPAAGFRYGYKYTYLPGDYRAVPDANARHALPFPADRKFRINQGFDGAFSHSEAQNRYAVDIGMPEGTPVLAARDGVVMTVDNDFYGNGLDMNEYGDRANNVRIVHDDGTMAVYAHLQLESAHVQVGDRVRAGQVLALSGETGYTNGPHLHFVVQRNANMTMLSVPFQFVGADGKAFTPTEGMSVGGTP
ncbi:MAG: M23 family metallopeptidase [Rudaea sp.]|uniref:M23 family metallopeptidase n=1 Tax=Rudaea sp. TaxID=2136325 RepID=UPI0039E53F75